MTSPRHFSPRLKLIVTPRDDRTDLGEKDDAVHPFKEILDTGDMSLILGALDLADRMVAAQAELFTAQIAKGRVLLLEGTEIQLHAANERIFRAEDEIDRIYHMAATLMVVVGLIHAGAAAAGFAGPPPAYVHEVIVIDLGPEA